MKLIDVTVPLDSALPTDPNHTPFSLEPIEMSCLTLRMVWSDGASARVVLRRS